MIKKSTDIKKNKGLGALRKSVPGWLLILPTILLFILIVWRPILMAFGYSFFKLKGFETVEFVGLKNFMDVLSDTNFLKTLWNTVQYVLWGLLIGFPLPFIIAVFINEMTKTKGFFKVVSYLPVVIPTIATCLIWEMIYADGSGGLLNTVLSACGIAPMNWLSNSKLVIPLISITRTWNFFGGTMILYLASLQSVDQSLYEAARLDGAGIISRVRYILLPHMSGILMLNLVRDIISIFQVTEQPLVMTGGGPNGASMSLGLTNYFYAFRYNQLDKSMALGVITFVLLIGLTYLYFKLEKKMND